MTISLLALEVKHERRVRLVFSNSLAGGAFGIPGPAYYAVTSVDGRGPSPAVAVAMLVSDSPNVVELGLGSDLVRGGLYSVSAVGVPATDLSVTPGGSELSLRYGLTAPRKDVEPLQQDRERIIYGSDLLWTGEDYLETADGDLATVSGTANVTKALARGVESPGLPWDDSWGAKAREFVDSPSTTSGDLRGAVSSQLLRDPRVQTVKVDVELSERNTFLHATPSLVSGATLERVTVTVPTDV